MRSWPGFWSSSCRLFYGLAALVTLLGLLGMAALTPAWADKYTESPPATSLTIKVGTAATSNPSAVYTEHMVFTEAEMTALADYQQMYSYYDAMPTPVLDAASGVLLSDLLAEAGIAVDQTEKFYFYTTDVADRPYTALTTDYLFGEPRYYFPNNCLSWNPETNRPDLSGEWGGPTDGQVEVYPMLAVAENWLRALIYGAPDFDAQDSASRYRLLNGQTEAEYLNTVDGSKKAAKWVYEIDVQMKARFNPPELTADSIDNTTGEVVDITFNEDPAWQGAISGVAVNGTALTQAQYVVGPGNLRLAGSVFPIAGKYTIMVTAPEYADALVLQTIQAPFTGVYNITIDEAISGGSIAADKATATAGEPVVLTVTPEAGKIMMAHSLQYTAGSTTVEVAGNSFTMPAGDVLVTAAFITISNNPIAWDGSIDTGWYNTAAASFQISAPAQLAGLASIVNGTAPGLTQDDFTDKTVTLTADLDLGGVPQEDGTWDPCSPQWTAIGGGAAGEAGAAFNGTFDGGGHMINNLYIERQTVGRDNPAGRNQGLFGITGGKALVKNLGVTGYVAAYRSVGGVVGRNWGRVESCFNAAAVTGAYNKGVGGVVGANWTQNSAPAVVNCYNTGPVHTTYEVGLAGGIAGDNEYLLANCYNAGPVSPASSAYVGGISGNIKNGSTDGATNPIIQNCYYNSAYNDRGIGNIDTPAYTVTSMEGKSPAKMKTAAFVDLLNAGSGNAFKEDTNNINDGYPLLAWQNPGAAGDVNGDGTVNIQDVVQAVNFILGETTPAGAEFAAADINKDGSLNIQDVVGMVNIVLGS